MVLVAVGAVFSALWLVDLLPVLTGSGMPRNVGPGGIAFAVYELDLVVALPAVVATGVALLRRHPVAPALAAVVLVKVMTLFAVLWAGRRHTAACRPGVHRHRRTCSQARCC